MKFSVLITILWSLLSCNSVAPKDEVAYEDATGEGRTIEKKSESDVIDQDLVLDENGDLVPTFFSLKFKEFVQQQSVDQPTLDVAIEVWNAPATATWDIYYTLEENKLTGAKAIAKDLPISQTMISWETANVPVGTYFLFATVKQSINHSVHWAQGSVTVSRDSVNPTPVIVVTQPATSTLFLDGVETIISYQGTSSVGNGNLVYKIELSRNAGASWETIIDGWTEESYAWTPSGLTEGAQYQLRITGTNESGQSGTVVTSMDLAFAAAPIVYEGANGRVQQALTDHCLPCHGDGDPTSLQLRVDSFNDINLGGGLSALGVDSKKTSIFERTRSNAPSPMPPNGNLPQNIRDLILLWKLSGYPRQ